MTQTIEIDREIYNALVDSFGESGLKEKMNQILVSAIENRLEKYNNDILKFERKYGVSFKEFEKMWDVEKIKNRHGYEIESDFIDWEMLEMEKEDLLKVVTKIAKSRFE